MHRARDRSRFGGGSLSLLAQASAITLAAGGALYDPSDLTSIYQSRTGGSTGASGSPVGIMLDKSYMGGRTAAAYISSQPEITTNGTFATDTWWVKDAGVTITGGVAVFTTVGSTNGMYTPAATLSAAGWYAVTFTVLNRTAGAVALFAPTYSPDIQRSADGTYTELVYVTAASNLQFRARGTTTLQIDNVSIKAIPGYHALAPSDAARPLLTVAGGLAYLTADGVDDWMNVTPTLNLGEAWWHVGGWRSDTVNRGAFTTAESAWRGALTYSAGAVQWYNSSDALTTIASGAVSSVHVLTVEQASTTSLTPRFNGTTGTGITPYNDSASSQALALFSRVPGSWQSGLAGRFYGGAFAPGALTTADRAIVERYVAGLSGTTASLLADDALFLAEATAALGGIAPYHYWDFLTDRFLFAQTTTPSRALSGTPGWSFSRASTGYAETAAGTLTAFASGELRRTDKGVLIEGARTNLLTYSQEFDNAAWTNNHVTVTANAIAAPDGTTTADKIIAAAANDAHHISQSPTTTAASWTFSVFAKAAERSHLLFYHGVSGAGQVFNLGTGALDGNAGLGAPTSSSITALAGGWYRCTMTVTATAAANFFGCYVMTNNTTYSYLGDGASGLYLWGAQVEAGAFPSSYIPTTTASATRAADQLVITGLNIAAPYSIFVHGRPTQVAASSEITNTQTSSASGGGLYHSATSFVAYVREASATTAAPFVGTPVAATRFKAAVRYATNNTQICVDAVLGVADGSNTPPTLTQINWGSGAYVLGGVGFIEIERLAIFNSALSDANLQTVTAT